MNKYDGYKLFIVLFIIFSVFFSYFILFYYPVADGFEFWHASASFRVQQIGFVNYSLENSQFYLFTAMLSDVSGIPVENIITLPLQAVPLLLFIVLILKNSNPQKKFSYLVVLILGLLYVTKFGSKAIYAWNTHDMGFILILMMISLFYIRYRDKSNAPAVSLIILITLVSLNGISYKMILFAIILLLSLEFMEIINNRISRRKINDSFNLKTLFLFGITFVLTFNEFFYKTAFPRLRFARDFFGPSGLEKVNTIYNLESTPYAYVQSKIISYGNAVWAISTLFSLIFYLIIIFNKIIHREILSTTEKIISALFISSSLILVFYTYLGLFEINYLIFTGFITLGIFLNSERNYRKIFIFIIILMFSINAVQNIDGHYSGYYDGLRDLNSYEYVKVPAQWYVDHVSDKRTSMTLSDTFTAGFVALADRKEGESAISVNNFDRDQILFILNHNPNYSLIEDSRYKYFLIFNYRINHVQTRGWSSIQSWRNFKDKIDSNPYMDKIYSSGDIEISKPVNSL